MVQVSFGIQSSFEVVGVMESACVGLSLTDALVETVANGVGSALVTNVRTNQCVCNQQQSPVDNRCELVLPDPFGTALCYPAMPGIFAEEVCTDINSFACYCPEDKPAVGAGSGCTPQPGALDRSVGALMTTKISVETQMQAWNVETLLVEMLNGEASFARNITESQFLHNLESNGCGAGDDVMLFMRSYPVAVEGDLLGSRSEPPRASACGRPCYVGSPTGSGGAPSSAGYCQDSLGICQFTQAVTDGYQPPVVFDCPASTDCEFTGPNGECWENPGSDALPLNNQCWCKIPELYNYCPPTDAL